MVNPADIEYAERFGMPEYEPEIAECAWCERKGELAQRHPESNEICRCEVCGKCLCEDCRIDMGEIIESYGGNIVCDDSNRSCVIRFLVSAIEQNDAYIHKLQAENNGEDELTKAAKKGATTGNAKDLHEYLRLRKEML